MFPRDSLFFASIACLSPRSLTSLMLSVHFSGILFCFPCMLLMVGPSPLSFILSCGVRVQYSPGQSQTNCKIVPTDIMEQLSSNYSYNYYSVDFLSTNLRPCVYPISICASDRRQMNIFKAVKVLPFPMSLLMPTLNNKMLMSSE